MQLHSSGQITKTCKQILPELADDLEQEIMLTLFEKPETKIIAAYNGGYFLFYVVRIIMNLARSKNSSLHRTLGHLHNYEPMPEDIEDERQYDHTIDERAAAAHDEMDTWHQPGEYPYDKNLFLLHLSLGNKKELSRRTGIPYRSVCYTIDNCKKRLRDALNND